MAAFGGAAGSTLTGSLAGAGMMAGPIGAVGGMVLGGVLDSFGVFGNDDVDFDITSRADTDSFEHNNYISTPLGNIGFYAPVTRNLSSSQSKKMLDAMEPFKRIDEAIANKLTADELNQVKSMLDGYTVGNMADKSSEVFSDSFVRGRLMSVASTIGMDEFKSRGYVDLMSSLGIIKNNGNLTDSNIMWSLFPIGVRGQAELGKDYYGININPNIWKGAV